MIDDPAALLHASPTFPPIFKRKPLFEVTFELVDIDPELVDILLYGISPGPHITLSEN